MSTRLEPSDREMPEGSFELLPASLYNPIFIAWVRENHPTDEFGVVPDDETEDVLADDDDDDDDEHMAAKYKTRQALTLHRLYRKWKAQEINLVP
jgi:hypothetical protein